MDRPTAEALPPPPLAEREVRAIIIGVLLAMLLAALDQTIVATAMPTIGRELGDLELLPWVVTAYLLTATAVTPLYGKLADIRGRRLAMLIGVAVFVVGSVACALAPTMLTLVLARALQGLGGGGLIALAQTVIADVVPPKERPRYQVYIAGTFTTSSLLGPPLGGLFAEHLHWSAIFWINLPLGLAAYWMTDAALRRLPRHDRPHRLDLAGAALMVAATTTLLLALSWGGTRFPWVSAPIGGLVAASALLWAAFGWRLGRAADPFIPVSVLRNPVVRMGTLSATFGMGTFIGLTIYVPIYFEAALGLSATGSGMALAPLMVGTVVGATVSGRLMARVGRYKLLPLAGLGLATASSAAMALFAARLSFPALLAILTALSLGIGTLFPVSTIAVQNAVPPHQLGTTTGVMNFFRQLGGALIVAIFGAIVLGRASVTVETLAASGDGADSDLVAVFRLVFGAAAIGCALAFAFLLAMEERPLLDAPSRRRP